MRRSRLDRIVVRPALPPLEPRFTPWVCHAARLLSPIYRRLAMRILRYEVEGGETLVDHISRFQRGELRFAVAFRHPTVTDPECVYYLFSNRAQPIARRLGVRFADPPHVAFLYGRGVPL